MDSEKNGKPFVRKDGSWVELSEVDPGSQITYPLSIENGGTGSSSLSNVMSSLGGINKNGPRGEMAGSETATLLTGNQTIGADSGDTIVIETSGTTTLTFTAGSANQSAIKIIALKARANSTLTISGASWTSGTINPPDWGAAGKILVLVAYFICEKVFLSVFTNS